MKRTMIALMVSLFVFGITAMSASPSFADETRKTTETKTDFFGWAKRKTETETKYDADGRTETRAETKTTK